MRTLEFRATGIAERHIKGEKQTDQSSCPRSNGYHISTPATSTILVSVLVVILVVRSTGSRNGYVLGVIQETSLDMPQAELAVDLAETTNVNGEVVLKEALDKAHAIKAAAAADPPEAFVVRGIHCTVASETIAAETRPARPDITIQVTVSSTDGFYSSDSRQTDSAGKVSFEWPSGGTIGATGTVSVTAVLSGVTAASPFKWVSGPAPPWEFDNSSK